MCQFADEPISLSSVDDRPSLGPSTPALSCRPERANAIYLEPRYLISLVCISRLPLLASSDDRCVSTRLPYSGPPVSRVLQHCAARYHRDALPWYRSSEACVRQRDGGAVRERGAHGMPQIRLRLHTADFRGFDEL